MSEPFIGEIKMVGFNFAMRGWALCNGQLLPINQNSALFSILGTTYGGDGRTTFGLPRLRGRVPVGAEQGNGLTRRVLGQIGGTETVTLNANQIPSHTHAMFGSSNDGDQSEAVGSALGVAGQPTYGVPPELVQTSVTGAAGGTRTHNNMQPSAVINFQIALIGIFPSRN